MDWYIDTSRAGALDDLVAEVHGYLGRHAEDGADVAAGMTAFTGLVAPALENADGRPVWVSIDWGERRPRVEVNTLGRAVSFVPFAQSARGALSRVAHLTSELRMAAKAGGGARVSATLPVSRPPEVTYDPGSRGAGALPAREEADERGWFGKEAFLRALVVQLADAVEALQGPAAAEAAVARVGADVGGRMEEEYRRARGLVGRLTREQIADLYVRLKAAIDGDFYVIDADERRIVLGNRRCPFGDAVKRAPGLCRMTSSVFGGIAARNTGRASVVLEERIAVGDPECRVVVWLDDPETGRREAAHGYHAGGTATG